MNTARTSLTAQATPLISPAPTSQPTSQPTSPAPLISALRHQIRQLETAGRPDDAKVISTGCPQLDQWLPGKGLATGTITEWLSDGPGHGGELLSLLAAKQACQDGGALVVVDWNHQFFPPAAAGWGIDLDNVIVLRRKAQAGQSRQASQDNLLWAIDQALRCPAVAAVWGRLDHVHERWLRRFQLSAEQSGAMGMFVRSARLKGQPGWAEVQWLVGEGEGIGGRKSEVGNGKPPSPEPSNRNPSYDRVLTIQLLRARSGQAHHEKIACLKMDFTTGTLQKVAHDAQRHQEPTTTRSAGRSADRPVQPTTRKTHSLSLASQLANPKTGGRQRRA